MVINSHIKKFGKEIKKQGGISFTQFLNIPLNFIKTLFTGVRKTASPQVRKFLEQHGMEDIISIQLGRKPIFKVIDSLLNIISLGTYQKAKDKYNYDELFHLYILVTLPSGKYKVEKNEVVTITKTDEQANGPIINNPKIDGKPINLNLLFALYYKKEGAHMWTYNAKTNNCQIFINNLLKYSNLLKDNMHNFIMQDAKGVLEQTPYFTQKIADAVTDLGALSNRVIYGDKLRKLRRKRILK